MSRASQVLEKFSKVAEALAPFDVAAIKTAWEAKLAEFPEFKGVSVAEATLGDNGTVSVIFEDVDGDFVEAVFGVDEDGPYCMAVSDISETDLDLTPCEPAILENGFFQYPDVQGLNWVNKSTLTGILGASSVGEAKLSDELGEEFNEAIGAGAKGTKKPVVRSCKSKCESFGVDEADRPKVLGGYHLKGTIKIGMTKEADGMLQKVTGFSGQKGDKPDNPMIHAGKRVPGIWLKPIWKEIRKIKTVRKQRHIVTAQQLAKSAKTRMKNDRIKQRMAGAAPAAA